MRERLERDALLARDLEHARELGNLALGRVVHGDAACDGGRQRRGRQVVRAHEQRRTRDVEHRKELEHVAPERRVLDAVRAHESQRADHGLALGRRVLQELEQQRARHNERAPLARGGVAIVDALEHREQMRPVALAVQRHAHVGDQEALPAFARRRRRREALAQRCKVRDELGGRRGREADLGRADVLQVAERRLVVAGAGERLGERRALAQARERPAMVREHMLDDAAHDGLVRDRLARRHERRQMLQDRRVESHLVLLDQRHDALDVARQRARSQREAAEDRELAAGARRRHEGE